MTRVAVIIGASLALTGCSSFSVGDWMPSMSGGGGSIPLRIESDPPGADARMSTGQSCRTPCTITVPAADSLTVAFALAGYETQTVPIDLVRGSTGPDYTPPQLSPNPVMAMLRPAGPPPAAKTKKKTKPKPRTAAPASERPAPAATGTNRSSAPPAGSDVPAAQRSIPGSAPTAPPASAWPPPR
jgi:hypothetical protein